MYSCELWWHWTPKSTDMQLNPQAHPLAQCIIGGVWPDFDLRLNLHFDLYQIKSISFDVAWWVDYELFQWWLWDHFWRSLKNQPPPLGHCPHLKGHQLTWDLKSGYQPLRLVTADMLAFFRETLAQSLAKRWGGPTTPFVGSALE